jgi:MazG family protein
MTNSTLADSEPFLPNRSSEDELPSKDEQVSIALLSEFLQIVRRLRRECPWDREQTHQSLRPMLIEEAYETVEAIDYAIDTGDYTELKKELGDLLLHILFHSDLAREEGYFTLDDVVQAECEKLIYRHPHVFGDVKVEGAEHVSRNWEQLKRREKGRNSVLDGVPASLPALQRAQRIQERASKVGFDWQNSEGVWKKIREEILELEEAGIAGKDEGGGMKDVGEEKVARPSAFIPPTSSLSEEFGDLLFSLVNLARHEGLDAEGALREATQKFDRRFRGVEAEVEASGKPMQEFTLEELDAIWDRVKRP